MSWPDMLTPWAAEAGFCADCLKTGRPCPDHAHQQTGPTGREIIARLEKIGGGDAVKAFRQLCVASRICSICGTSWDNPHNTCECTNVLAGES